MTGFDILVRGGGAAATYGFLRGFVQEAISLAAWAAALIAVRTLHTPLSDAGAACGHQQRPRAGVLLLLLAPYAGADAGADGWFAPARHRCWGRWTGCWALALRA
jgi:membrane protein required for colicin V production